MSPTPCFDAVPIRRLQKKPFGQRRPRPGGDEGNIVTGLGLYRHDKNQVAEFAASSEIADTAAGAELGNFTKIRKKIFTKQNKTCILTCREGGPENKRAMEKMTTDDDIPAPFSDPFCSKSIGCGQSRGKK